MNLLLAFFLSGLFLQGIKTLFNYLITRSENFNESVVAYSDNDTYINQLSVQQPNYIRVTSSKEAIRNQQLSFLKADQSIQVGLPVQETFIQTTFNKSA